MSALARHAPRVYSLLAGDGYSEEEIRAALEVVPPTMDAMPIARRTGKPTTDTRAAERLHDRCAAYIERTRAESLPRHNGFTEDEWRDIMAAIRRDSSFLPAACGVRLAPLGCSRDGVP